METTEKERRKKIDRSKDWVTLYKSKNLLQRNVLGREREISPRGAGGSSGIVCTHPHILHIYISTTYIYIYINIFYEYTHMVRWQKNPQVLWPYVDLSRGRLIVAHRSDLRSAIGQLARLVGYEPTSEKINIRPLDSVRNNLDNYVYQFCLWILCMKCKHIYGLD